MTIERINAIQQIQQANKLSKKEKVQSNSESKKDEVKISNKAKEALELSKLVNKTIAQKAIRFDKVSEAKQKIADGFYFTKEVTEKMAESIAEHLV